MMSKRLVIALMLLVGATSATLAQGHHHNRAGYGQDPDPASGRAYYRNGPVYELAAWLRERQRLCQRPAWPGLQHRGHPLVGAQ